jgi:hypothetical protein
MFKDLLFVVVWIRFIDLIIFVINYVSRNVSTNVAEAVTMSLKPYLTTNLLESNCKSIIILEHLILFLLV